VNIDGVDLSLIFMSDITTIVIGLILDDENSQSNVQYSRLCHVVLQFLRKTLDDMLQCFRWMRALIFYFCIRCPICVCSSHCKNHNQVDCHRDSCVHYIPERDLSTPKPRCDRNPTILNNVIPDSKYSHWFPKVKLQVSSW